MIDLIMVLLHAIAVLLVFFGMIGLGLFLLLRPTDRDTAWIWVAKRRVREWLKGRVEG
jgi:hypothetical protein